MELPWGGGREMGDLSVRTFSMLAAHLDGGMNCGAVTLLSEV